MTAFIHPKAHVEGASIGEGAKVFQFASVFGGAVIGAQTIVGPCAMVNGSRIGENCRLSYGVNMGPGFWVGDNVFLGPEVVLCNDRWPRVDKEGFDVTEFDGTKWAVIIEDGASLGVRATVLPGVRIGRNAVIAAHAVVARDVPDGHIYWNGGLIERIDDEAKHRAKRMKFAQAARRPFEGESLPHVSTLDAEQLAMMDAAGVRPAELEAFR